LIYLFFNYIFPTSIVHIVSKTKGAQTPTIEARCKQNFPVNILTRSSGLLRSVISYGRFGKTYQSHLQGSNQTTLSNIPGSGFGGLGISVLNL
jgi:hypothetical protein